MYKLTHLEDWICDFYRRLEIKNPKDIDMKKICYVLNIFLVYKDCPSMCFESGRFKSITLNVNYTNKEQREDFFHELCHLLRHCGRQYMMPKAFLELQEFQAKIFTKYASLPYPMLSHYDLNDQDIIYILSEDFGVTERLVTNRLKQIKQRMILISQHSS